MADVTGYPACRIGVFCFVYFGQQGRKQSEREARVALPLARLTLRTRLVFASVRPKYAQNYACSAGYRLLT